MKVLRRACGKCGHIALFSVEAISRPGSADTFGEFCPFCRTTTAVPVFFATELDIEELDPRPVDIDAVRRAIEDAIKAAPDPSPAKDPVH